MTRGVGVAEALRALLPEASAAVVPAASVLGNPGVVLAALVVAYWFGDRRRVTRLLGVVAAGFGVALLAKAALGVPRPVADPVAPPGAVPVPLRGVYAEMVAADGPGFPSGHATTATVSWGALALGLGRADPIGLSSAGRRRVAGAAVVVVLVSAARLALGVHVLVDVVGGAALGTVYLVVVLALVDRRRPDARSLGLAGVAVGGLLAAVAAVVGSGRVDALAGTGAGAGAVLAWALSTPPRRGWSASVAGAGRGLLAAAAVAAAAGAVLVALGVSPPTVAVATGLATAVALVFPGALAAAGVDDAADDDVSAGTDVDGGEAGEPDADDRPEDPPATDGR